jgi:hypothetical protein
LFKRQKPIGASCSAWWPGGRRAANARRASPRATRKRRLGERARREARDLDRARRAVGVGVELTRLADALAERVEVAAAVHGEDLVVARLARRQRPHALAERLERVVDRGQTLRTLRMRTASRVLAEARIAHDEWTRIGHVREGNAD